MAGRAKFSSASELPLLGSNLGMRIDNDFVVCGQPWADRAKSFSNFGPRRRESRASRSGLASIGGGPGGQRETSSLFCACHA